jgi:polysaccharide biosynthesis protein VpsM
MKSTALRVGRTAGLVTLALLSGVVAAQQSSDAAGIPTPRSSTQPQAGGVPMGPMTVYPSVIYELKRDDNIFLQAPGSGLVRADTINVLKPAARAEGKYGAHAYAFGLGFDSGRYNNSSADNYDDNNAFVSLDLNPDTRVRVKLDANHLDAHDPRGSTNDAVTTNPNRYRQEALRGIFGFGAQGAQGRFELEAASLLKHYTNNRSTTYVNDRDEGALGGTFFWRVAPRTSLLAQVRQNNINYVDSASLLTGTNRNYLVGVTWEATAATTGIVKLGQVQRKFDKPDYQDFSEFGWEAQVQWTPLSYSKWDFLTSRLPRETSGNYGSFVWSSNYAAKWTHAWTSQVSTAANASYVTDEYQGLVRTDHISTLGLRGTYQMRRWLSFGADYSWQRRDSDLDTADYKRNIFLLFVNATL